MRRDVSVVTALIIGVALIVGVGSAALFSADTEKTEGVSEEASDQVSKAELTKIERRLDEALASQGQLLQKFDVAMEELRIIKVRATTSSRSSACP